MGRRHSIQCIIPPHMLRELASRGKDAQKSSAFQTLSLSAQCRGERKMAGAFAFAGLVPAGEKRRTVFTAGNTEQLPGKLVRGEGDPAVDDPAVNEAYDGAGATYDFYKAAFSRNSIDNRGMRLDSTVHYGDNFDNALWNGSQMIYGDGDNELFGRFTTAIDVIGHELTHGVTQFEAGLEYQGQSGALNESISDVFGSMVKQKANKQTAAQADWLIGVGLFAPGVHGQAIRSMKAPGTAYDDPRLGKDPQPATMKNFVRTNEDNGGVHINSGIPNYAFYLVATALGGFAWEKAGLIWYTALPRLGDANADFKRFANVTVSVAGELFAPKSKEQNAVRDAWAQVGIKVGAAKPPKPKSKSAAGGKK
jgi:Zn-dependent metalloprotease